METACNKNTMLSIHFDMWQWFDGKKNALLKEKLTFLAFGKFHMQGVEQ